MTPTIESTSAVDSPQEQQPALMHSREESETERSAPASSAAALEPVAGDQPTADGQLSETTPRRRKPLTPEQHQQKILRDRARRAAQAASAASGIHSAPGTIPAPGAPIDDTLTQAQRDKPYRERLSAQIQADDKARATRIAESQRRRAEVREKSTHRG